MYYWQNWSCRSVVKNSVSWLILECVVMILCERCLHCMKEKIKRKQSRNLKTKQIKWLYCLQVIAHPGQIRNINSMHHQCWSTITDTIDWQGGTDWGPHFHLKYCQNDHSSPVKMANWWQESPRRVNLP